MWLSEERKWKDECKDEQHMIWSFSDAAIAGIDYSTTLNKWTTLK